MAAFKFCAIVLAVCGVGLTASGAAEPVALRESSRGGEATRVLVTLKAEGNIMVGPFEVRRGKGSFGKADVVKVVHSEPNIKSAVFLDKDGKVIPSQWAG